MYRTRYGKTPRRPRRKYIRRARKVTKKPSKFLKRTIQSMISKNVEDKEAYISTGDSLSMHNSGINSGGDVHQILPDIYNGSTEQHRLGDNIRAKTLVIKGHIQLTKDQTMGDVANKRVAVRIIVGHNKRYKGWDDVAGGAWLGALLKKGGTSATFNGNISDLYAPINTEEVTTYYDKIFYLAQDYVAQQVGSSTPTMTWSQDISKGVRFFTIRIPLRGKKLIYDPSINGNKQPTNFAPFLLLGYAHLDGSSPDVIETRVGLCYDSYFTYEDA